MPEPIKRKRKFTSLEELIKQAAELEEDVKKTLARVRFQNTSK